MTCSKCNHPTHALGCTVRERHKYERVVSQCDCPGESLSLEQAEKLYDSAVQERGRARLRRVAAEQEHEASQRAFEAAGQAENDALRAVLDARNRGAK